MNQLHVKQTILENPGDAKRAADMWAADEVAKNGKTKPLHVKHTILDNPGDAKQAADTQGAGWGS